MNQEETMFLDVKKAMYGMPVEPKRMIRLHMTQNALKMRVAESLAIGIFWGLTWRTLFPKMGIRTIRLSRKFAYDLLPPLLYLNREIEVIKSKIEATNSERVKDDKTMEERRLKFKSKFWSNSQYWH